MWSVSKFRRRRGQIPVDAMLLEQGASTAFILSAASGATFKISRDAKICKHTVIGSNPSCMSLYEQAINVERTLAQSILQKFSPSDPPSLHVAIETMLAGDTDSVDVIENGIGTRFLSAIERRIKRFGTASTLQGLKRIASRKSPHLIAEQRTHIHRAMA